MSSAVAPLSAMTEHTTSPTAATTSRGSSRRRHSRGTRGGGGSEAGWIGVAVVTRRGERSGREGGDRASSVGAGALDELLVGDVEPLREDEARRRCGGLRAEAAALDRDGHDDRARLVRDVADVPGLVGLAGPLDRARLAVDGQREALHDRGRGAAVLHRRAVEAGHDGLPVDGRDVHLAPRRLGDLLDLAAEAVLDLPAEVRTDHAPAVDDRRVGDGHLQRRGLEVALADGEVHVVAGGPRALDAAAREQRGARALLEMVAPGALLVGGVALVAPLGVRDETLRLAGDVDAGAPAEPEPARPGLDHLARHRVGPLAERVEEDVGGDLERLGDVERAVRRA